jgi:hypothetical protein
MTKMPHILPTENQGLMGVTVRKKRDKWYVFVNHNGQRKAKCVGTDRTAALKVKQALEAKLTAGEKCFSRTRS